jgi:NAD(P)-dependent dehydrogenase (short-subunit alcohol dehydrogenase family)
VTVRLSDTTLGLGAEEMQDIEGKLTVITGGTSGIGLGTAKAFLDAGARVVATYRTERHLDSARGYLGDAVGKSAFLLQLDVADRNAMAAFAEQIETRFGPVHVLCNNAGIGIGARVVDASYADWDWAISVNLGGVINGIREFLPRMQAHGEGSHIVSTASMGGIFLNASAGVYNATKYAVVGVMESLRDELSNTNIGVSVYCPGLVNTDILTTEENRPSEFGGPRSRWSPEQLAHLRENVMKAGMDPREAGEYVLRGVIRSELYIFSHPEFFQGAKDRFDLILMSLAGDVSEAPQARIRAEAMTIRHPLYARELGRMVEGAKATAQRAQAQGIVQENHQET